MNRRNRRIRAVVRYRKPGFMLMTVQEYLDGQHFNVRSIALLEVGGVWHSEQNHPYRSHPNGVGAIRTSNYDALYR